MSDRQASLPEGVGAQKVSLHLRDGDTVPVRMIVGDDGTRYVTVQSPFVSVNLEPSELRLLADAMEAWPEERYPND